MRRDLILILFVEVQRELTRSTITHTLDEEQQEEEWLMGELISLLYP
jgi:hypothetical protein